MFTDYKILAAKTPDTLTELVREHMKKGYQPLGVVVAVVLDGRINLYQAVVTKAMVNPFHLPPLRNTWNLHITQTLADDGMGWEAAVHREPLSAPDWATEEAF